MAIFQISVINKYLQTLDKTLIANRFAEFQKFYGDSERVENIKLLKEENYQEGFLREIFVEVLGYTINPDKNYNLTTEYKNETDAKKADGAILSDGKAIAVIELKSTKTKSMESIQEQAFNYKNNQSNCKYVITSNFHKLRFYIDNATEYEEFNLFTLTLEEFSILYLLLSKESIFNDIPSKLKDETKFHEENISDKFYKDYSSFKKNIYQNLIKNNPEYDKLVLFKKSQKFLDRLLFVFFAEDTGLVPPNSISSIVEQWKQLHELEADQPLYDRFKLFFSHLNSGHNYKNYNLPAYNGGLFAPDDILDNIIIDDEVLNSDSLNLSSYDFNTDIDVNILGHIFEHSLSEIEEITSELEGSDSDKKKSKRKKDGIFYTPKYITQYIVDNTVGTLCKEKREEIGIENIDIDNSYRNADGKISKKGRELYSKLEDYKTWLLSLKILDPACGSGAFLNQALSYLIKEHKSIDELISELINQPLYLPDNDIAILENNIYGVDINEESVEIAKLSLWLRTARKGRKLSNLSNNIKCGNSLIDDPLVAGDKAFNWNEEFQSIMVNGGFDVVIGNPPYVRQELLGKENKRNLIATFSNVGNGTADLYIYFYELGMNVLKNGGFLSFITPNKWFKTKYGLELRKFAKKFKILDIIDFFELQIFHDASTEPQITTIQKQMSNDSFKYFPIVDFNNLFVKEKGVQIDKNDLSEDEWVFVDGVEKELLNKLFQNSISLKMYTKNGIKRGILTGLNSAFIISNDIKEQILKEDPQCEALIEPYANATDIKAWHIENKGKYYIINTGYDIEISKKSYRGIWLYLNKFIDQLQKRQDKGKTPFNLRACDYYDLFYSPKIIFIHTAVNHHFFYDTTNIFVNNNSYIIANSDMLLSAILNSKIFNFLKIHLFAAFGNASSKGRSRLNQEKMSRIPIPKKIDSNLRVMIEEKSRLQHEASNLSNNLSDKFLQYLQSQFHIESLSKKLLNWYELEFYNFIKELNKSIIKIGKEKLTKIDEMEWMEVFEIKKNEINILQSEISKTDNEIDRMVYELYGLTEEEIEIVESG